MVEAIVVVGVENFAKVVLARTLNCGNYGRGYSIAPRQWLFLLCLRLVATYNSPQARLVSNISTYISYRVACLVTNDVLRD